MAVLVEDPMDVACCPWWFPDKIVDDAADWIERKKLPELEFYSPDYPRLARKEKQLVFVYGTLKRGFHNHDYLKRGKYLCNAVTKAKDLVMYHSGSHFPVVIGGLHKGQGDQEAHIEGELYEVPTSNIKYLDYLEGTPNLFVRAKTCLKLLHPYCGKQGTQLMWAWMYVGNPRSFNANSMKMKTTHLFTRKTTPELNYYTYIKPGTKLRKNEPTKQQ